MDSENHNVSTSVRQAYIEEEDLLNLWEKYMDWDFPNTWNEFISQWCTLANDIFPFPWFFNWISAPGFLCLQFTFMVYLTVHPIVYLSRGIQISFLQIKSAEWVFMDLILFSISLLTQERLTWKSNVFCWLKAKSLRFNLCPTCNQPLY